ncbi:hypothetical protein [Parachitinimonas caeni]|uniref:Type IV secretion system protein VirB3 n=1 Tax=Parachitinimonas caeni TaxID=3031301 RepID=A0ABT7E1S4_9NEIS|nr:hypothetical protein [Parachitinimonas caeni]MDK2126262.1 hypothetical protein [Parachitinimonas caeni]
MINTPEPLRQTPMDTAVLEPILLFGMEFSWLVKWLSGSVLFIFLAWLAFGTKWAMAGALIFDVLALILLAGLNRLVDPNFFSVLWRYYQQAALYDPWPHRRQRRGRRPRGFGRGNLW